MKNRLAQSTDVNIKNEGNKQADADDDFKDDRNPGVNANIPDFFYRSYYVLPPFQFTVPTRPSGPINEL